MKFKVGDKVWWWGGNSYLLACQDDIGTIISIEEDGRYMVKWHDISIRRFHDEIRIEEEKELMLMPLDGNLILKDML